MLRLCTVAGRRGRSPVCKCVTIARQTRQNAVRDFRTSASRYATSSGGEGSGVASVLAGTALFSIGVGGGVFGYAAFDDKFRKSLEESVPGSKDVFDTILGPLESPAPKPKQSSVPPPKLKLTSPVMVTKPKEEKEVKEEKIMDEKKEEAPKPSVAIPPPPLEAPPPPPIEAPPPLPIEAPPPPPIEAPPSPPIEAPPSPPIEAPPQPPIEAPPPPPAEVLPPSPVEVLPPPPVEVSPPPKVEVLPPIVEDSPPPSPPPTPVEIPEPPIVEEPPPSAIEDVPPPSETPSPPEEIPTLPSADLSSSPPEDKAESESPKLEEDTTITTEKDKLFPSDVENDSLEQVLRELQQEMRTATDSAVKSMDQGADAVVSHISIMQSVLESNLAARDDNSWNQVFEAATAKSEALKLAERKEKEALAAINNVAESIEAGRRNKTTATNPELLVAEEEVSAAMYKLEQGRARIGAVEGEARVVEQYRDIVEEGRQQFNKEMAAIMPDVKLGESNKRLTEDELNMFITHAYRKVLYLQQELAKQQTLEQQRFKQALEKLKIEAQMAASEKMDNEMERQKREMELEHQKRLATMKEDAEAELRIQLRRQAAAHSDHITDVLTIQEAELSRKHEHNLDESLSKAESNYLAKLAGLNGTVEGLVSALEDRSKADQESVSAQKLWMACLALRNSIELGNLNAADLDTTMKPLGKEITAIKEVAGDCEVVNAIVSGIPEKAVERGVYTETALRDRFNKVESVARRVARIGDDGGSLLMYGVSYLESMLLIDTAKRTALGSNEPIDVQSLDCHAILSEARFSLERGDIVRAVQFMRLLEGEPRRVASDWISEARLHLEAKQASQALIAHAAAVGLQVLP